MNLDISHIILLGWFLAASYAFGRVLLSVIAYAVWHSTVGWAKSIIACYPQCDDPLVTGIPRRQVNRPTRIPPMTVRRSLSIIAWNMRYHQRLDELMHEGLDDDEAILGR